MPRALNAFAQALKLAAATNNRRETVLAHLFRGEALYRMDRIAEAGRDFDLALAGAHQIGAAEEEWTVQYGLGRVYRHNGERARALGILQQAIAGIESVRSALGAASLKTEFLADKRDVYDASIDILLQTAAATPAQFFGLFERARSRNLQDALRNRLSLPAFAEIQRRLDPHSLLIEYWIGPGRVAALWIAQGGSGIVTRTLTSGDTNAIRQLAAALPAAGRGDAAAWRTQAAQIGQLLLAGIPTGPSITHLLIVPDGLLHLLPFEALSLRASAPLLVEQFAVSYLPSAALLPGTDLPVPRRAFGAAGGGALWARVCPRVSCPRVSVDPATRRFRRPHCARRRRVSGRPALEPLARCRARTPRHRRRIAGPLRDSLRGRRLEGVAHRRPRRRSAPAALQHACHGRSRGPQPLAHAVHARARQPGVGVSILDRGGRAAALRNRSGDALRVRYRRRQDGSRRRRAELQPRTIL